MLLDIRKLFEQPQSVGVSTFSLDVSGEDFPGYRVVGPCEGSITTGWEGHGSRLRLRLEGQALLEGECARCLAPVRMTLPFARTALLRRDALDPDADDPEDLPLSIQGRLDVDELVYTEILVAAPTTMLCRSDCAGLCPVCGRPMAEGCGCNADGLQNGTATDES